MHYIKKRHEKCYVQLQYKATIFLLACNSDKFFTLAHLLFLSNKCINFNIVHSNRKLSLEAAF